MVISKKKTPTATSHQIAQLYFDNRIEMEMALRSPERALAAEDGKKLSPRFIGEIKRQTFEMLEYVVE